MAPPSSVHGQELARPWLMARSCASVWLPYGVFLGSSETDAPAPAGPLDHVPLWVPSHCTPGVNKYFQVASLEYSQHHVGFGRDDEAICASKFLGPNPGEAALKNPGTLLCGNEGAPAGHHALGPPGGTTRSNRGGVIWKESTKTEGSAITADMGGLLATYMAYCAWEACRQGEGPTGLFASHSLESSVPWQARLDEVWHLPAGFICHGGPAQHAR